MVPFTGTPLVLVGYYLVPPDNNLSITTSYPVVSLLMH